MRKYLWTDNEYSTEGGVLLTRQDIIATAFKTSYNGAESRAKTIENENKKNG